MGRRRRREEKRKRRKSGGKQGETDKRQLRDVRRGRGGKKVRERQNWKKNNISCKKNITETVYLEIKK